MNVDVVSIAGRRVGAGSPCLVIAEAGVNHDGDVEAALALIDAAADAGADVVKFQTFSTQRLAGTAATAPYQAAATGDADQATMLRRLELPDEVFAELRGRAAERGILFLSSPFDEQSVDLLVEIGVPALKFGSGELTNLPLLRHGAATGLPLIVSTGMATMDEVAAAVDAVPAAHDRLILLHCVSAYPAEPADANLAVLATMRARFGCPVGFSDHTVGPAVAIAAVAFGAAVLEKHLTLDRSRPGPDHAASLEPAAFAELVTGVRAVEAATGDGVKRPVAAEGPVAAVARRSLVAASDLPRGHRLTAADLVALRPAGGISPAAIDDVVGHRLHVDVSAGTPLRVEDLES